MTITIGVTIMFMMLLLPVSNHYYCFDLRLTTNIVITLTLTSALTILSMTTTFAFARELKDQVLKPDCMRDGSRKFASPIEDGENSGSNQKREPRPGKLPERPRR